MYKAYCLFELSGCMCVACLNYQVSVELLYHKLSSFSYQVSGFDNKPSGIRFQFDITLTSTSLRQQTFTTIHKFQFNHHFNNKPYNYLLHKFQFDINHTTISSTNNLTNQFDNTYNNQQISSATDTTPSTTHTATSQTTNSVEAKYAFAVSSTIAPHSSAIAVSLSRMASLSPSCTSFSRCKSTTKFKQTSSTTAV
jgi:hypothetical protein